MHKKYIIFLLITFISLLILSYLFFNKKDKITLPKNKQIKTQLNKKENTFTEKQEKIKVKQTFKTFKNISKREEIFNENKQNLFSVIENRDEKVKKLFMAILENDYEYLLKLHKQGIKFKSFMVNKIDEELILQMASYFLSDFRILDILLEQDLELIDTYKSNAFQNALEARNFPFLEYLILNKDYDINYNVNKFSLKFLALGHKDLEEWIEKFAAEYSAYDKKNFLRNVNLFRDKDSLEQLVEEGFIFSDEQISQALRMVCLVGNVKTLEYLNTLPYTIDKNYTDNNGNNILLSSITMNNKEIQKWLLKEGYNPNQKNNFGENALSIAVSLKKEDFILYLLENDYMNNYEELIVKGKLLDSKKAVFEKKIYKNLYEASKAENLKKVKHYLENKFGY